MSRLWIILLVLAAITLVSACGSSSDTFSIPAESRIEIEGDGLFVSESGRTVIDVVVAASPGWLCTHADQNGKPGEVLGCSSLLPAGESLDVPLTLDMTGLTSRVHSTLYKDGGEAGVIEVPDPDVPAVTSFGKTISVEAVLLSDPAWITVQDQPLSGGDTVTIERVFAPVHALLVIHDGRDQQVLGFAPLEIGENRNVTVKVEVRGNLTELIVELHWDENNNGELDFNDPASRLPSGDYMQVRFRVSIGGS